VSIFVFPGQEGDYPLTRPYLICYSYYLQVTTDVATILSASSTFMLDDSPIRASMIYGARGSGQSGAGESCHWCCSIPEGDARHDNAN
jgi:hypothetical protein